ncbi:MAG: class II glutamine amidotransferase [Syntrophobacteraceae bacterium]|jgi:glutamine amidotransferase
MCELLGISSSTKIRPGRYFRAFRQRGQEFPEGQGNPDGWGIALYPDGRAVQVIKEAIPAACSKLSEFLSTYEYLCSKIFIAHVRKASRGIVTYSNTHPFSREIGGKDYVFAHNGTIRSVRRFALGRHKPVGKTDSEHLFCYLLSFIEERNICGWTEEDLFEFWRFLIAINRRSWKDQEKPNKLNMLLTDGETLIAYTDFYGVGTLYRLILRVNGEVLSGKSKPSTCLQSKDNEESICIVATRPVNHDKRWVSMEPGELCAFRNGVLVFSSGKSCRASSSKGRPCMMEGFRQIEFF